MYRDLNLLQIDAVTGDSDAFQKYVDNGKVVYKGGKN